jgi:hypothetical protein
MMAIQQLRQAEELQRQTDIDKSLEQATIFSGASIYRYFLELQYDLLFSIRSF